MFFCKKRGNSISMDRPIYRLEEDRSKVQVLQLFELRLQLFA